SKHSKKGKARATDFPQGILLEDVQTYVPLGIEGDEFKYFFPHSLESGFIESSQPGTSKFVEDEPFSSSFEEFIPDPLIFDLNEFETDSESAEEEVTEPFQFLHLMPKKKSDDDEEEKRDVPVFIPKIHFDFAYTNPGQTKIPFSGNPGLHVDCPERPIDFFRLIANEIFMNRVIEKINTYAESLKLKATQSSKKSPRRKKPRIMNWKPLTAEEFDKFLALIFLMGQVKAPDIFWYWKASRIYHFPTFSSLLHRDRFQDILRLFHIDRNFEQDDTSDTDDPSDELKPLDIFNNNMKEIYYPGKKLTIDKFVISPRGLHIREDDTDKCKFGVKVYTLSETSGLILKIHTHTRLKKESNEISSDQIVHELLSDFQGKGHVIFLDETFVNYPLAKSLLEKKTHTLGMLGKFKIDNTFGILNVKLKKDEVVQQFSPEGICVMKYRYKGIVWMMISSEHAAFMRTVTERRKNIEKPQIFIDYTAVMNSERTDKFLMSYPCDQRLPGWSTKLAIHVFHIIMHNSYILFDHCYPDVLNPEEFREKMIEAWLKIIPSFSSKSSFLTFDLQTNRVHVPRMNERLKERKRCVVCNREQIKKQSRFFCPDCPHKPG
ncbi:unnamed protein product, partial [Heterotrigona itama]